MILFPRLCRRCTARLQGLVQLPGRRFVSTSQANRDVGPSILFFGSDTFSIASLSKLHQARQENPALYESLQIVTRRPARKGRGLKETPTVVEEWAKKHDIPYITTLKGSWDTVYLSLQHVNLLVAVSFGLFIPGRILSQVDASINVHPSLLPQYRGPCPIHQAILNGDKHTGVTLQTLSPHGFDKGTIFDQSQPLEIRDNETLSELWTRLADKGAEMLVNCIQQRTFLNPVPIQTFTEPSYAGYVSYEVDWDTTSAAKAIRKGRVFELETGAIVLETGKRTPIHVRGLHRREQGAGSRRPGDFFVARHALSGDKKMVVVCDEGETAWVDQVKVSGKNWISGLEFASTAAERIWGGKFVPWRREFEDIDTEEFGYGELRKSNTGGSTPS